MTQLDREIGTLVRDGVTVYYVTVNEGTGETAEAAHPAELPSAEEVERLRLTAKARAIYQDTLSEIDAERVAMAGGFHLVTPSLMCVVWAPQGPGFCLGTLLTSKGNPFTAKTREIAEAKAALWNEQLTPVQVQCGCTVEVLHRQTALERLEEQTKRLLELVNERR